MTEAVILAAGTGSRLGEQGRLLPKGFLELGGRTLIGRSVDGLRRAGITRVVIGTGHLSECYEELAARETVEIVCVKNRLYEKTGSLETLCCLKEAVRGDFLLLESDLLYEERALEALLEKPAGDWLLVSGFTGAGDEVYAGADRAGRLTGLSKDISGVRNPAGELVGITRLGLRTYEKICDWAGRIAGRPTRLHYEDALTALAGECPVRVLKVEDLAWAEIDHEDHLRRAVDRVLPRILHEKCSGKN